MKNNIVKEDMICPATGKYCDDECCTVGSECNIYPDDKDEISADTYPFTSEDEAIMNQCYEEIHKYEQEIEDHNNYLISSKGQQFIEDFKVLTSDVYITNKIEIVDSPEGDDQEDDESESFSKIYVQQWNAGLEDSYAGFIYAQMRDGKWLKIPYSC